MATPLMSYRPWVGNEYKSGFRAGLKLLILGHSHYGGDDHDDDERNATERWTKVHIEEKPSRFWTHIEQVISGRRISTEQRREFWNKVAFSNFIQEPLDGPGVEPTEAQRLQARRAFPEIISHTYKPDVMFVFSIKAWERLPDATEYPESSNVSGYNGSAYLYHFDATHRLFAGVFAHPRNPRVARIIWHAWSEFLFSKAISLLTPS